MTHSPEDLKRIAQQAFLKSLRRYRDDQAEQDALLQKNGLLSGPASFGLERAPNDRWRLAGLKVDLEPLDDDSSDPE